MDVTIFGSGYVGLVTGACLSDVGNDVVCMDVDSKKIDLLNDGQIPIFEPGLKQIIERNVNEGRLTFTTDAEKAVRHGLFQLIAVGTPPGEDGSADLQYVLSVAKTIAAHMTSYKLIVNKSTVPIGTADKVTNEINRGLKTNGKVIKFDVVSNPEFLKEGAAINDFMKPDRIIVGTNSREPFELLSELYAPFNRNSNRLIKMDVRSAELTKYAANAMLATKISFMNELANLAEHFGADIEQVRNGIGSDIRIGYSFIYPGCGFGGSCFPKDINALEQSAATAGLDAKLLRAVRDVNNHQKTVLLKKIDDRFKGDLNGKTFALWGLSFKPNTDDMREAPSRVIIEALLNAGATIRAYDPVAIDECKKIYTGQDNLIFCENSEQALKDADALVVATEWQLFRSPDFDLIKSLLKQPLIFDGRNLYDPETLERKGIEYWGIGRGRSIKH